jgi:pyruvate/2-oxoglutarate dehydrogenase complex dihydrolipoamide dehydrogenase (E3) component
MAELLQPDICVIGCGPGAIAAATGAAALGARAVLVRYGLSSPALQLHAFLTAAARAQAVRSADRFGVSTGEVGIDFGKLKDHVRQVAAAVAPNETPERLAGLGIRVIDGTPRFTSPNTLAVDDRFEIKPKHVVIAVGSAVVSAIDGLNGEALTPESIFDLDQCPKNLAVIGANAQGLELAQAFLWLGATVTVIDPDKPLPGEDAECAAILLQRLQAAGVTFRKGRPVRAVNSGNAIDLTIDQVGRTETLRVSHVLVANGRLPAFGDLNLGLGGVASDASGIMVDDYLRSSNPKVFAIGEAAGSQSVAAANQQAAIVIRNLLLNAKSAANRDVVPRTIFTDPEFAHVGLGEVQARALYRTIRVQRWPFHQNDRAQAERDTTGHVKIVALQDGTIIGATIVGRGAADQIAALALAVEKGLGVHDLSGWTLPYPSRAQAGKLALTALEGGLTRPGPNRIISLLRRRG